MGAMNSQSKKRASRSVAPFIDIDPVVDMETSDNDNDAGSVSDSDYEQTSLSRKRNRKSQKSQKPRKSLKTSPVASRKQAKLKESAKPFPFLELPAELRNAIYGFALAESKPVHIHEGWKKYRRVAVRRYAESEYNAETATMTRSENGFRPAILCASRQIHAEAAAILYGNAFEMKDTTSLYHFLGQVGSHKRFLKDITVIQWGYSGTHKAMNHPAMTMLCDAVNLQRLFLNCHLHYSTNAKNTAQKFYRDAHFWLEAVGTREKSKTAALELMQMKKDDEGTVAPHGQGRFRRTTWRWGRPVADCDAFFVELKRLLEAK